MHRIACFLSAIILSSAFALSTTAHASPAKSSSVEQLFALSEIEQLIQSSLNDLHPQFETESENIIMRLMGTEQLDAQQLIAAQEIAQILFDTTKDVLTKPQVKIKMKDIMQNVYTEEEVQAYIRFLSTAEGRSINRKDMLVANQLQKYFQSIAEDSFQNSQFEQKLEGVLLRLMQP